MTIKNFFVAIVCMNTTLIAFAQTSDAEAEAMINLLGVQKKEAMAKLVSVSGNDSVAFWKLYNEYHQKNLATAKSRIKLYEETAQAYGNMTPAAADALASCEKALHGFAKAIYAREGLQERAEGESGH